jgi:uncharacterized protein YqhQ
MRYFMSEHKNQEESLAFGGQALIEGVMMRSGKHMVLCVRQPNQEINTHVMEISSVTKKFMIFGLPFLRGIFMLFETLYYGVKGIFHSANIALEEEDEEFTFFEYVLVIVMVLVMNGFFIAVPFILTNFLNLSGLIFNLVESVIRLGLFVLYLYIVSKWGEFNRILQYHGAEHKTINAYEAGVELSTESVSEFSRLNPRCGTSFLFITILISVAMFALIPETTFTLKLLYRILLIPVIAGVSYEVLKYSDRHRDSKIMHFIITPGLWFQKLTTKEPTESMIRVAVEALEEVKQLNEPE